MVLLVSGSKQSSIGTELVLQLVRVMISRIRLLWLLMEIYPAGTMLTSIGESKLQAMPCKGPTSVHMQPKSGMVTLTASIPGIGAAALTC